ncbi:MAG TPA: hypothetical protein VEJ68_00670, partial [Candidatus Bathyarchaeia archaeon]|nr:hypothetical protein [Candidatus Bathyarchaeia archaeon]
MEDYNHINPLSVESILTLRYDSTLKPLLQKLTWRDFVPSKSSNEVDFIEKVITENIRKTIDTQTKRV